MRRTSAADHGHGLCWLRDQAREQPRRDPACFPPRPGPAARFLLISRGTDEGSSQVLIDCLLGDPERTSDADRFQFAGVDQAVHGHL